MANKRLVIGLIAVLAVLLAAAAVMGVKLFGGNGNSGGSTFAETTDDAATTDAEEATGEATTKQTEPSGETEDPVLTVNRPENIKQYNIEVAREQLFEINHEEDENLYFDFDRLVYEEMNEKTAAYLAECYMDEEDKQSYLGGVLSQYHIALAELEAHTGADGSFDVMRSEETLLFRADDRVFSMMNRFRYGENTHGVVPQIPVGVNGINLDAQTGEALTIADVVSDPDALKELVIEALIEKYVNRRDVYAWDVDRETFDCDEVRENLGLLFENKMMMGDSLYHWAPAYLGMRFIFYTEGILPYDPSKDSQKFFLDITVPYTAAPEIFDPYFTAVPERFVTPMEQDTEYLIDFGKSVKLFAVHAVGFGEEGKQGECRIRIGDTEQVVFDYDGSREYRPDDSGPYTTYVYLVRDDDRYYLWLQYELSNAIEYRKQIQCYALEEDGVRHIGMTEDSLLSRGQLIDPEGFTLEYYPDILRTGDAWDIRGIREYTLENGQPKLVGSGIYQVTEAPVWETNRELRLTTVSETGEAEGETTVPAGTRIRMVQTNGEDEVTVETQDGTKLLFGTENGTFCDLNGEPVRDAIDVISE